MSKNSTRTICAFRPGLMGDFEKALLDYCYLHPELRTADNSAGLRFNTDVLRNSSLRQLYQNSFTHQRLAALLYLLPVYA